MRCLHQSFPSWNWHVSHNKLRLLFFKCGRSSRFVHDLYFNRVGGTLCHLRGMGWIEPITSAAIAPLVGSTLLHKTINRLRCRWYLVSAPLRQCRGSRFFAARVPKISSSNKQRLHTVIGLNSSSQCSARNTLN